MSTAPDLITAFMSAAERWLADGYSHDIRYLAIASHEGPEIVDAALTFAPLPYAQDLSFRLTLPSLRAGHVQLPPLARDQLLRIIEDAAKGQLTLDGDTLSLPKEATHDAHSNIPDRNTWYSPLHLQLIGRAPNAAALPPHIDGELRTKDPPFDGLQDLATWLGLRPPTPGYLSTLSITVNPPVDLRIDLCGLQEGKLRLVLHALPHFDRSQLRVALAGVPPDGVKTRIHVADRIVWSEPAQGRIEGAAVIDLGKVDTVLTMLVVGSHTVRRQYFVDPAKTSNSRLAAVQQFDRDLRMIRQGLFEASDSSKFEAAVASLLFLLGFAPAVQLEADSPDIIVTTPGDRLALVECTIRVADVPTKLGKLVDRRGALKTALSQASQSTEVMSVLVSRQTRDQIAAFDADIRGMGVVLVTSEDITEALLRVRFPTDPDQLYSHALERLQSAESE